MRKVTALTRILTLSLLAVAGTEFVSFGVANPYEAYTYTAQPIISVNSPSENETFSSNNVPLGFTITKPNRTWLISWTQGSDPAKVFKNKLSNVSIVIDDKLYKTVEADSYLSSPFSYCENLTNLEYGAHNLTIIAYCDGWDLEAHGFWERYIPYNTSSALIAFTIAKPEPSPSTTPESFPITLVITASPASVAAVAAGLLVYFKKRKR